MKRERVPGLLLGVMDGGVSLLERRVLRLLEGRVSWGKGARVVCAGACVAVMGAASLGIGMLAARAVLAQDVDVPRLEVIAVKKVEGRPSMVDQQLTADGLSEHGWPIATLIRNAYIADFHGKDGIVGIPAWAGQDRYDIVGKVGEADVPKLSNPGMEKEGVLVRGMLQQVLRERFQLKTHVEDREGPIYALVLASGGSKLKKAKPGDTYADGVKYAGTFRSGRAQGVGIFVTKSQGITQVIGQGVTLDMLAWVLTGAANTDRLVLNKTGSNDRYDFTLSFVAVQMGAPGQDAPADANGPSVFSAVQEQLGLKLEATKGPVKTLVIDSIERPTEN